MGTEIIKISIAIIIVSAIIFIVKNNKTIGITVKKITGLKYFKITYGLLFIPFAFFVFNGVNKIIDSIDTYNTIKENNNMYAECDSKIIEERSCYNSIISMDYENQDYKNPYIPENFTYLTGEWDTGFVIQDEIGNEFVWVPCTNKDNLEVPKLDKRYFYKDTLISKDFCYDIEYQDFLKSALENGGFYISRYEIGKENSTIVSKPDVEVYNNVSQEEAIELAQKMYESSSFKSELINGYAYDTTFAWIFSSNSSIEKNNIKIEEKYFTKRDKSYNNIYDIFDNILEITLEKNYNTVVVRGVYNQDVFEKYSVFFTGSDENRYSILETDSNNDNTFRVILYK